MSVVAHEELGRWFSHVLLLSKRSKEMLEMDCKKKREEKKKTHGLSGLVRDYKPRFSEKKGYWKTTSVHCVSFTFQFMV